VSVLCSSALSFQYRTKSEIQILPIHKHCGRQWSFRKSFDRSLTSILVTLCFALGTAGQTSDAAPGAGGVGADRVSRPAPPLNLEAPPVKIRKQNTETFDWRSATREALLYTGVMHSFRFATEAGTRDALHGPWFNDWMASVSEIRGWNDGDPFITDYVAHSIEGGIFGFIQQNNDPRYRLVEWGSGRDYWISRLRALSFSAVMSTQWKIGPASEASLGNVQLHEPAGFTDLVNTPTLGVCLMIAEDMTDRFAITGLENRTANRVVLMLARSFLNPSRTFSNLMAFKEPWYRATRVGLFRDNFALRKKLLEEHRAGGAKPFEFEKTYQEPKGPFPLQAPIELMASAHYESFLGGGSCIGGGGTGAFRISPSWQIVGEVSGCLVLNMPNNESGDSEMYSGGARWTPRASGRISPYVQVLIGGRRITHEIDDPEKRQRLLDAWNDGNGTLPHYPMRSDWSTEHEANGFGMALGGGLDLVVNRALAWRVGNLEYTHTWIPNVDQIHASDGVRFTSGLTLRIGTW
jgi:hypothetical protein